MSRWRVRALTIALLLGVLAAEEAGAQPLLYVLRGGPRGEAPIVDPLEIVVVDPAGARVVGRIPLGMDSLPSPVGLAIAPDGARGYVTNSGALLELDLATLQVSGSIPVGGTPGALVLSRDGSRLFVGDQGLDRVSVVDTSTRAVVRTMDVPGPASLAMSSDGTRLFAIGVPAFGGRPPIALDRVYVIDANLGSLLGYAQVGLTPRTIVPHPDGTRFYVTRSTGETMLGTGDTVLTYESSPPFGTLGSLVLPDFRASIFSLLPPYAPSIVGPSDILPDGSHLYVTQMSQGWRTSPTRFVHQEVVRVVDTETLSVVASIPMSSPSGALSGLNGVVVFDDGPRVFAAGATSTVSIDRTTYAPTVVGPGIGSVLAVEAAPRAPCFYELSPSEHFVRSATSVVISVPAPPGCSWNATSEASWLTFSSPSSGVGAGVLQVAVAPSVDPRTGVVRINGRPVIVTQPVAHTVIDLPGHATSLTPPFDLRGWAIDVDGKAPSAGLGSGVDTVHVYAYPTGGGAPVLLAQPVPTNSRADIGAAFGLRYTHSGFDRRITRLGPGQHTIVAYARSANDGVFTPATTTVTVVRAPTLTLESPAQGASVAQPFHVAGWAADLTAPAGTGVDAVHVWAYPASGGVPVFLGAATYGIDRADVGFFVGEQPFRPGFDLTVSGLASGAYTIVAFAHCTLTGTFDVTGSASVLVDPQRLTLDRPSLRFGGTNGGAVRTAAQQIRVSLGGMLGQSLQWRASLQDPMALFELQSLQGVAGNVSGIGDGAFMIALRDRTDVPNMDSLVASVRVESPGSTNSPQFVDLFLRMASPGTTAPPFGFIELPAAGVLSNSAVVSGWALDDVEVAKVEVWRQPHPDDPAAAIVHVPGAPQDNKVFVGVATFVEDARPDVASALSTYPVSYRAGWGYMMLTRGLIWDGDGPFLLHAIAYDREGHAQLIGSRQTSVSNLAVTRPFGAIDSPQSGETVSGMVNVSGWVLAARPRTVPAAGVRVYIDGVYVGDAGCLSTRPDLAGFEPEFDTSQAARCFTFDSRTYSNGLHSIGWAVTDSAAETDGVGNRFFRTFNPAIP